MTARAAALLVVAAVVACTMRASAPPSGAALVVVAAGAPRPSTQAPVVFAEVAATPAQRQRGLGGRASLPADGGMLFVYPDDEPRVFWMKDCLIGLDIAFIGRDLRILNVATLPAAAGLPDEQVPKTASQGRAPFVLETESGWFARHGLGAGDEVDLRGAAAGVLPR